jgi:transcriptional regulator with XRE-family HTH domain
VRNLYEEVGQRIRVRRLLIDISQTELAQSVKLTRTSISNIENGRQHLPLHTLYRVAGALGCHPIDLLPNPSELTTPVDLESVLVSATERVDLKQFLFNIHKDSPAEG